MPACKADNTVFGIRRNLAVYYTDLLCGRAKRWINLTPSCLHIQCAPLHRASRSKTITICCFRLQIWSACRHAKTTILFSAAGEFSQSTLRISSEVGASDKSTYPLLVSGIIAHLYIGVQGQQQYTPLTSQSQNSFTGRGRFSKTKNVSCSGQVRVHFRRLQENQKN